MQISANKEKLYINQVIGQKSDTLVVEEDFVVPDIKPDILSIINTGGTICVYKKDIMDGKVKIEGCINAYIIYLADDPESNVRGLNTNVEFSEMIEFPSIKEGMMIDTKLLLKNIECKIINGRKINIKAIVDVNMKALSNEEVEFINEIENCRDIQILNEEIGVNSLLGRGSTRTYAKDTLVIDSIDNLAEILKVDVTIINKELKISYNKILVKADACVKILYLTEDRRICKTSQMIPIMGFVDMQDISDEDTCDIDFEIKNLIVKPNSIDEHSIYVEIELEINCSSYKNKNINLIQDLYSPCVNLNYNQKQMRAITNKNMIRDICSIRENRDILEIGNRRIYDVSVNPTLTNKTILTDRIVFEGEVALNFMFEGENNRNIDVKNIVIPFNYSMNCVGVSQESEVEVNIDVTLQDFTVMSEASIDIKIDLEFNVNVCNTKMINVIDDINEEENINENRHSLVIYFVKPGDTLWNIAKKFHSTVQNIAVINQLEDENKINVGEQLFIPVSI